MGVPTGFEFGKGSYGPFSDTVKLALHDFANRNWVHEEPLGRMVALKLTDQYAKERTKYSEPIELHAKKVAKVVDLFSRINSTEQAEEVITVLYSSRQLKGATPDKEISEQQVFDFILDWKKSWNTAEKKLALMSAIRNLTLLGWLRVNLSDEMDELDGAAA